MRDDAKGWEGYVPLGALAPVPLASSCYIRSRSETLFLAPQGLCTCWRPCQKCCHPTPTALLANLCSSSRLSLGIALWEMCLPRCPDLRELTQPSLTLVRQLITQDLSNEFSASPTVLEAHESSSVYSQGQHDAWHIVLDIFLQYGWIGVRMEDLGAPGWLRGLSLCLRFRS